MRNVEIKAKVHDIDKIVDIATKLSGEPPKIIKQEDIFYKVLTGRLKLRLFDDSSATLVRYDREDKPGPKISDYDMLHFPAEENDKTKELHSILKKSLGIRGQVTKVRQLFMVGQTRIHIDSVRALGHYMELEVVLRPEQTLEDGQAIARDLQTKLGVSDSDLIDCAYVDMLDKNDAL